MDPKLIIVRLLGLALAGVPLVATGAIIAIFAPSWWLITLTAVVAVIFTWQAIRTPARVHAMAYAIRDRDFFLRRGLLYRHLTIVPYVRIQYVDINISPLEKIFGLASISIATASVTLSATMSGITPDAAAHLRDILTDRARLTGAPVESEGLTEDAGLSPSATSTPSTPNDLGDVDRLGDAETSWPPARVQP